MRHLDSVWNAKQSCISFLSRRRQAAYRELRERKERAEKMSHIANKMVLQKKLMVSPANISPLFASSALPVRCLHPVLRKSLRFVSVEFSSNLLFK